MGRFGEESRIFHQRRTRIANSIARDTGLWSKIVQKRLCNWFDHVERHPESWISRLLRTNAESWLESRRLPFVNGRWTLRAGRTCTRANAGYIHIRYENGLKA